MFSEIISADAIQRVGLELSILSDLVSNTSLACGEEVGYISLSAELVLKVNTLSVGPGDVIAELLPAVLVEVWFNLRKLLISNCIGLLLNLIFDSCSSFSSSWAVYVIKGQHVIVRPAIHLNWEYCRLVREGFEPHLLNPGSEVKSLDWRNCVVLLAFFEHVVVLARRVESKEHCLSTKN